MVVYQHRYLNSARVGFANTKFYLEYPIQFVNLSTYNRNRTLSNSSDHMKRKLLITVAILLCFAVCYAATTNISGKWTGNLIKADSTNYPLNYNFTVTDSLITGTAQSALGTFPIDSGKLDTGNNFHFQVTVNGGKHPA